MWRALSGPDGIQQFAAWICALVLESSPERRAFSRHGRQQYVGRDAVAALHAVSSSRVGVACGAGWLLEGMETCDAAFDGLALPGYCSAVLDASSLVSCACLQLLRVQQTQSLDLQAFLDLLQVGGCCAIVALLLPLSAPLLSQYPPAMLNQQRRLALFCGSAPQLKPCSCCCPCACTCSGARRSGGSWSSATRWAALAQL